MPSEAKLRTRSRTHAAEGNRIAWAVFFLAMALLGFELVLTRLFSVVLWNHFAFLAISVALLGLGTGGLLVYLFPGVFSRDRAISQFRACAFLLPPVLCTVVAVLCILPIRMDFTRQMLAYLGVVFLLSALPFAFGGVAIAIALGRWPAHVNRIYGFDLAGSALGCLLVIGLLHYLDGPSAALALGVLSVLAGFLLRPTWSGLLLGLAVLCGVYVNSTTGLIHVRMARSRAQGGIVYEGWNAFSRVTVFPTFAWRGWWVAPNVPDPAIPCLGIQIDADAFTPMLKYDGDAGAMRILLSDIVNVAYRLLPNADSAIVIGSGGGKDVRAALLAGTRRVTAVELNPIIARDIVSDRFRDFSGDIYGDPRVELIVGEGRTVLRHDPARYDIVQLSMVDTSAASAAGAYALTENSLYTLQAAREFLARLTPGGILTATWVNFPTLEGGNRLVALYAEALRQEGLAPVDRHLAVLGSPEGHVTILARPSGFRPGDVAALRRSSERLSLIPLYLPGDRLLSGPMEASRQDGDREGARHTRQVVHRLIAGTDLERFYDSYPLDLRPVTDDRPFFFYQQRFRDVWGALTQWNVGVLYGNGLFVVTKLIVISALAVVVFLGLPLVLAGRPLSFSLREQGAFALYFFCLGIGFIAIEIALVQLFGYYLGHPLLGLGVCLASLLLFGGIGSYWGQRWSVEVLPARLVGVLGAIVGLVLLYGALLSAVTTATISSSLAWRIAIVMGLFGPVGILLGVPFPSGLRILAARHGGLEPWAWALNAGATVLGSSVATMLVLHLGFIRTLLVGAAIYAVALAAIWRVRGGSAISS